DVTQVDRSLRTPSSSVLTVGGTRELSSAWSVGARYTFKQSKDLLQDADRNHVSCVQYGTVFHIDPANVCPAFTDPNGNVVLGKDLFGTPGVVSPNGLTDLYVVNNNFNRVMRVGNFNGATYREATVEVERRLAAGWQLQGSYTLSRVRGDG